MAVSLLALRTGRVLLSRNIIFLLLVLVSVRHPGLSAAGRISKSKAIPVTGLGGL
jgi:hypothetical protein